MINRKNKKLNTDDHIHREFGLLNNWRWTLKNFYIYDKKILVLIPLAIICAPIMNYLWTFISKFVIDMITENGDTYNLIALMAVFTLIQISSTMINTYCQSEIWWRFIYVRFHLINQLNKKGMSIDFEHLENPDIMNSHQKASNASGGNYEGVEGIMHSMLNLFSSLAVCSVGLIILGTMNYFVVAFMLMLGIANFLITNHTNKKCKKKVWDPLSQWWRKHNYMYNMSSDFSYAKDIRMLNLHDWMMKKFSALNKTRYEFQITNEKFWFIASLLSNLLWVISQAAIYAWLIYSVFKRQMTVGNFSLYLASSATFFSHITSFLNGISSNLSVSRQVDDFRSFLEFDGGDKEENGIVLLPQDRYSFEFRNVSFKYPKSEKYALKGLNLTLNAGERLAVVGLNGAGKSTFIKLLLRLYNPCEGEILLNGKPITRYTKKSYFNIFAPVFQNIELFAFPLSENVSMKSPQQTDKAFAEGCLRNAGLGSKLDELENGIDTQILKIVYDDGIDLSGGEKQKLALARALYKNSPVVILDEPTAALDAMAESRLYKNFDKLIGDKAAVYISHRLSSTQFCQNVAMFKDGEMIEYGTHQCLLNQGGEYAQMFKIQAQYYVENSQSEVMTVES